MKKSFRLYALFLIALLIPVLASAADTPNKGYILQGTGTNRGTWGVELNNVLTKIDLNLGGMLSYDVSGSSDITVSASNSRYLYHKLTGILTGNIEYILPDKGGFYIIENATTGSFTLEVSAENEGVSITVPQGKTVPVFVNAADNDVVDVLNYFPGLQASNARLTDVSAITPTDNAVVIGNGSNLVAESGATFLTSIGAQPVDATLSGFAAWTNGTNKIPLATATDVFGSALDFSTDGTLASNSDTKLSSEKAVKTYVDTTVTAAVANTMTLGTAVASTSGTSINFTSIPAGVKRVTINFSGVSTSGTSLWAIQVGDSGGVETSGYLGSSAEIGGVRVNAGNDCPFRINGASSVAHGSVTLDLLEASTNTWTINGALGLSSTADLITQACSKSLSATLDRVRITTAGGVDTFDAGKINIIYEQ